MANETVTVTVEADDESTDEFEVPTALLELLSDCLNLLAQRIHGAVHHAQGEPSEEVQAIEEQTMDIFEDRFGATFGELTGHDH